MAYSEIFRQFAKTAKSFPAKSVVFFKQDKQYGSLSYQQLYNRAVRLGKFIREKGAKETDNIVILLESQPEWPMAFMAIQSVGAIAVPIDINLPLDDIRRLILHCEAKIVLCGEKLYSGICETLESEGITGIFAIDSAGFFEGLEKYSGETSADEKGMPADTTAAMFYTSGTTNLPKGVLLSQRNLLSNAESLKKLEIVGEKDTFISFLPLHHTYSFMVTCLFPLLNAAQISYPASLTSEDLLGCLKETKVTVLTGVPQIFMLFHQKISSKIKDLPIIPKIIANLLVNSCWIIRKHSGANFSKRLLHKIHEPFGNSLRYLVSGGARLEPDVMLDFLKWGFTLIEGYGLTETSPVSALNPPARIRIGSVGQAIPDVQIKIINPDNKGKGEVAIKGPNVMLGYYKMPGETKEKIQNEWFFSGDLGYLDKDNYLYIQGRKDELIVLSSGKKVNPEEIEKHYSSAYIKEMCVFAANIGGAAQSTKQLMAVVVPNTDYFRSKAVASIEETIKWEIDNASHRLAAYRRIKGFILSKEPLPRTRLGKLMRHKVEEAYSQKPASSLKNEGRLPQAVENLAGESCEQCRKLLEFLSKRLKRKVRLEDNLELDLGLDSLNRIELLLELKKLFGIELPESAMTEFFLAYTIKELFDKLKPYLKETVFLEPEKDETFWLKALREEPNSGILKVIRLKPLLFDKIITLFFSSLFRLLFLLFFRLEVKGKKNLPEKGPYIIYANHTSYLDGFLIFSCLSFKIALNTYFLGLSAYFLHPLVKGFNKPARMVAIDTTFDLVRNMQVCAYILKNSKILCFFPEGQRSPAVEGIPFKKGIGVLAKELNAALIPIYIDGAFKSWPRFEKFPKPGKIKITIGQKITYADLIKEQGAKSQDIYEDIALTLKKKLTDLKVSY